MPKEAIKYENTVIYKIVCLLPNINNIYVGYTTDITRKKYYHKIKSMNPINNKYKLNNKYKVKLIFIIIIYYHYYLNKLLFDLWAIQR